MPGTAFGREIRGNARDGEAVDVASQLLFTSPDLLLVAFQEDPSAELA